MEDPPESDRLVEFLFRIWSGFYDQPIFQRPFYRRVHAAVLRCLGPEGPRLIVDVGCGTAQLTADLASHYPAAKVVGVDLSDAMLAAGTRRMDGHAPFLARASVYALPFADGSVDLVTSTISYHWYLEPRRALRELRRVLHPGGQLILAALTTRFLRGVVGRARLATLDDTMADLADSGFHVERYERLRPAVRIFVAR